MPWQDADKLVKAQTMKSINSEVGLGYKKQLTDVNPPPKAKKNHVRDYKALAMYLINKKTMHYEHVLEACNFPDGKRLYSTFKNIEGGSLGNELHNQGYQFVSLGKGMYELVKINEAEKAKEQAKMATSKYNWKTLAVQMVNKDMTSNEIFDFIDYPADRRTDANIGYIIKTVKPILAEMGFSLRKLDNRYCVGKYKGESQTATSMKQSKATTASEPKTTEPKTTEPKTTEPSGEAAADQSIPDETANDSTKSEEEPGMNNPDPDSDLKGIIMNHFFVNCSCGTKEDEKPDESKKIALYQRLVSENSGTPEQMIKFNAAMTSLGCSVRIAVVAAELVDTDQPQDLQQDEVIPDDTSIDPVEQSEVVSQVPTNPQSKKEESKYHQPQSVKPWRKITYIECAQCGNIAAGIFNENEPVTCKSCGKDVYMGVTYPVEYHCDCGYNGVANAEKNVSHVNYYKCRKRIPIEFDVVQKRFRRKEVE